MNYEVHAVVFDLDGLMLNTEDIFDLTGHALMRRRGKVMTAECHHQMLGRRPDEAFEIMKRLLDLDESIDDLQNETREIFASLIDEHLGTMHGLYELLDLIEGAVLPKAVATSSPREYMTELMNRFELLHRFPVSLAAEDVTAGKPEPEIYLKAAELLEIEPANMVVLEDSEAGTRAAAAAGAIAISVPNRHTKVQDFSMATRVVESLADERLLELIR